MDEAPAPRKSSYAVPYRRFAGDAEVDRVELVVEQPHEPLHDVPMVGDGGDGDGD
jgi:hypothetical protein